MAILDGKFFMKDDELYFEGTLRETKTALKLIKRLSRIMTKKNSNRKWKPTPIPKRPPKVKPIK